MGEQTLLYHHSNRNDQLSLFPLYHLLTATAYIDGKSLKTSNAHPQDHNHIVTYTPKTGQNKHAQRYFLLKTLQKDTLKPEENKTKTYLVKKGKKQPKLTEADYGDAHYHHIDVGVFQQNIHGHDHGHGH